MLLRRRKVDPYRGDEVNLIQPGATSQPVTILVVDDAGLPVTGLVAATFPATTYQRTSAAQVAITLSDLAAVTSAYSSGGLKELGSGRYRLDVPDAAFASASMVTISGEATGKHVMCETINVADITGALVKTVAAVYDSATASGSVLTLSNGHTQTFDSSGNRTTG